MTRYLLPLLMVFVVGCERSQYEVVEPNAIIRYYEEENSKLRNEVAKCEAKKGPDINISLEMPAIVMKDANQSVSDVVVVSGVSDERIKEIKEFVMKSYEPIVKETMRHMKDASYCN